MTQGEPIYRVHSCAIFQGLDGEQWAEEEMAPIVAVMEAIYEGARHRFRNIPWPFSISDVIGWNFFKRTAALHSKPYWYWQWAPPSEPSEAETPEDIAYELRQFHRAELNREELR